MRLRMSAALLCSACTVVALSGCGATPANSTIHNSTATVDSANTSSASGASQSAGTPGNTLAPQSAGSSAQNSAEGGINPSSSDTSQSSHDTTIETKPGQSQLSARRSAEDFTLVSTGELSNAMEAKFAPTAWVGMGEAALMVTPMNSYGLNGNLLYVLTDSAHSGTGHSQAVLLNEHAISAVFSKDGKWLAVETQTNQGSVDSPNEATHLWLMSVDGSQREDMGAVPYVQGTWVGAETFMYTDGSSHIYTVTPGGKPTKLALNLPAGVTIGAIRVNQKTGEVAVDEVIPDADKNIIDRHDAIVLWNPETGALKTLLTAPKGDGFLVGPWTADGTQLFYWRDPMHSGSIAADGLQLRTLSADGKTQAVATTLTGIDAVQPLNGTKAVIQSGGSRYLFVKKSVQIWNGSSATPLHNSGASVTQVWPTVSPDKTLAAYSEGPVLKFDATQTETSQWWEQLQLVVTNLKSGVQTVVSSAGKGVVQPTFTADNSHLTYVSGSEFNVVSARGKTAREIVFKVSPTAAASYPQWPSSLPVEMVDYHS